MNERGLIPRKVKGFRDIGPQLNGLRWRIVHEASRVYRSYGFEHWDTPVLEYAECVGKHLPDSDTPEEGVYSFRNPELEPVTDAAGRELRDERNFVVMEGHYLALRYDLTAPLARKYAEELWATRSSGQSQKAPPLFRRFQYGPVYRFDAKLDPGRFREFWQLDFDTVGVADVACDAEVCCILCDALEAVGLAPETFEVRVNTRNLHRGLFEKLAIQDVQVARDILRVVDKYDKIGSSGVAAELGKGRVDPQSGASLPGLGLPPDSVETVLTYVESCMSLSGRVAVLAELEKQLGGTQGGDDGLKELTRIHDILSSLGYGEDRVVFDPSVARGLAYYTGPVFEVVSKLEVKDQSGQVRKFGAISGGGRYDGLVERLLGLRVPATGASIGVDRLADLLSRVWAAGDFRGPVLVVVMDPNHAIDYQLMARELRLGGVEAEVYYGQQGKLKAQLAYADSRNCPVAVLAGGDEFAKGTVSLKNLALGREMARTITDRSQWLAQKPAQVEVARTDFVATVRSMLGLD